MKNELQKYDELINSMMIKPGETIALTNIYLGGGTGTGTPPTVYFSIPLNRPISSDVSAIAISGVNLDMRCNGTRYVLSLADFTPTVRKTNNGVQVILTPNEGVTVSYPKTQVCLLMQAGGTLSLAFS